MNQLTKDEARAVLQLLAPQVVQARQVIKLSARLADIVNSEDDEENDLDGDDVSAAAE